VRRALGLPRALSREAREEYLQTSDAVRRENPDAYRAVIARKRATQYSRALVMEGEVLRLRREHGFAGMLVRPVKPVDDDGGLVA